MCGYHVLFIILFSLIDVYRSDDMTGQFTLAALEEEQYPVTHRRVSDLAEQGVSSRINGAISVTVC